MDQNRHYAIALKFGLPAPPPADWEERLANIPGVTITGATGTRAQFTATPEGLNRVTAEFSSQFFIEELQQRSPLG